MYLVSNMKLFKWAIGGVWVEDHLTADSWRVTKDTLRWVVGSRMTLSISYLATMVLMDLALRDGLRQMTLLIESHERKGDVSVACEGEITLVKTC